MLAVLSMGGCATILDGSTQQVSFQTTPENVVVTLISKVPDQVNWTQKKNGTTMQPTSFHDEKRILGTTPFALNLDRAGDQSVMFSMGISQ
jgi:hypothetical protein